MLIQAIGTFTVETEGQKAPLVVGEGDFADLPGGVARDAIAHGTAREVAMADYLATLAAPAEINQQSSATEADAVEAPRRGKRSNSAKVEE